MTGRLELCIIGAGTAGFAAAESARREGRRLVVISGPGALGGTCILRGCMPAKTLLSSTEVLGEVEKAPDLGVDAGTIHVDIPAIIDRKRELVDYFAADRRSDLEEYPLVRGEARFVSAGAVALDNGDLLEAERFVIATGSKIVPPQIPGLRECGYITSDDVLEMKVLPANVIVIGGGPVGCEFAQYFARLGKRVTLLQDGPALLRNEDDDVAQAVAKALEGDGVEILFDARVLDCKRDGNTRVVQTSSGSGSRELRADAILLAGGRRPNVASLDLAKAGIELHDEGGIRADRYLRTTNPAVYAAGDVLGRRFLVHVAEYAGKLAAHNAFAAEPRAAEFERYEAHAVYTQPQVAVAGLTEREAQARNLHFTTQRLPFSEVGKALVSDHADGFVKMLAARDGKVIGAAMVGDSAIDLIGEAIALIDRGATAAQIADMPHLHPTLGEILGRVAERFTSEADPLPDVQSSFAAT